MSLNSIYPQSHLHVAKGLLSILNTFVSKRNAVHTLEEKVVIEGQAIELLNKLIAMDFDYVYVRWGEIPTVESFVKQFSLERNLSTYNQVIIKSLAEQYIQYFNSQQTSLMELSGKLQRIQQKISVLDIWDIEKSKFVLGTSFNSLEGLSYENLPGIPLRVETSEGVALLPLKGQKEILPKNIVIGSSSNGNPGNSDKDIDISVGLVQSLLTTSVEDWFEYERLDSGPCFLQLNIEISKEEIINQIKVIGIAAGDQKDFSLDSITLIGSFGRTDIEVNQIVKSTDTNGLTLSFLPFRTKTVILNFSQTDSYAIETVKNQQVVSRQRYSIGLQNIFLYQNEYDSVGYLSSEKLKLPGQAFVCLPVVSYTKTKLIDLSLSLAQDENGFESPSFVNGVTSSTLLNSSNLRWLLEVKRKDDLFGLVSSLEAEVEPTYKFLTKTVSRNETPAEVFLPLTNKLETVFVYQPKLIRRGEKFEAHLLGRSFGTEQGFDLPVDIPARFLSNFKIRVNGLEYDKANTVPDLGTSKWAFSDDLRQIRFDDSLLEGSKIQISLDEELLNLEERADGFYQQIDMLFDPDPERVSLTMLSRKTKWDSVVLPYDQRVIKLGVQNIQTGSFTLVSGSEVFTEVFSLVDVYDALDNDYYVDYKNGILHLARNIGDKVTRATFRWHPEIKLKNKVIPVFVDGKPWGIKLTKDSIQGIEFTEVIGDAPLERTNSITGLYEAREDVFSGSTTRRILSYDQIIKGSVSVSEDLFEAKHEREITYIDGVTEFLGLTQVKNEKTTAIAGTIVTFNLTAGGLWYEPLGVSFSNTTIFNTLVGSAGAVTVAGEYYVEPEDGEVTVYVGGTLSAGIDIVYYFRNPDFDSSNKYSVDYKNGILYSSVDMDPAATIRYKSVSGRLSYDLVQELPYTLSGTRVSVSLETLKETNSLLKVAWGEVIDNPDIVELRRFYSPIIRSVGLRCS